MVDGYAGEHYSSDYCSEELQYRFSTFVSRQLFSVVRPRREVTMLPLDACMALLL